MINMDIPVFKDSLKDANATTFRTWGDFGILQPPADRPELKHET
jgi:hypothetical protein